MSVVAPTARQAQAVDTPPPSDAARQFERMRTGRSNLRYQARPTGAALAERAVRAAAVLIDAARERIQR